MTETTKPSATARTLAQVGGALRPWLILAVVCAGFSLHPTFRQTFWTADYLPNILQQAATNIILAVGLTFVILTGGIDLSVGSVMALCGVTLGLALTGHAPAFIRVGMVLPLGVLAGASAARAAAQSGAVAKVTALAAVGTTVIATLVLVAMVPGIPMTLGLALLATLAMGLTCGLINGLVISIGKVPPFVVTLGMYTAARGLTVYATDGNSVSGLPPQLGALGQGWPLVAISLVVVLSGIVLHTLTRAGRMIVSVGANEEATRLSGVDVTGYKLLAYLLTGITTAIAAIVLTAKFQLADTGAGMGAELNAIAAVVIGGTSLNGGRGTVLGSLVGALTIAVLNAGMVLVGVKDTLQGVVIGTVIVLAVMLDRIRRPAAH